MVVPFAGLTDIVPGGLLRFLLLVNITSDLFPDDFRLMAVKVGWHSQDDLLLLSQNEVLLPFPVKIAS